MTPRVAAIVALLKHLTPEELDQLEEHLTRRAVRTTIAKVARERLAQINAAKPQKEKTTP